jgi:hypothetical protein
MRSIIRLPLLLLLTAVMSCAPRDESVGTDSPAVEPPVRTTPASRSTLEEIRPRIDAALQNVESRQLEVSFGFWTIFHGILGMGPDVLLHNRQTGEQRKALELVCNGADIEGLKFEVTEHGLDVVTMPGSGMGQGHQDQFVAEMVEWGVPASQEVTIGGRGFTFADFYRYSRMRASVTKNQELSWALVIVGTHFGVDHHWTNQFAEKLSYEDLVRYELNQPIDNSPASACGGTHRLWGLTWAYQLHRAHGDKDEGLWRDVRAKLDLYKANARKFQNPDGAFSTQYVAKAENNPQLPARIASTGHVLEWLALELSDDELHQPWVQDAVSALAAMILENQNNPIDGGALYHAVHGLYIYRARVFGVAGPRGLHVAAH